MSYTIFGDLRSGAFSAEAALAEVGAPYEFRQVSLKTNEQKSPAFLAVNPSGKLPALKTPEGDVVTESLAILLTIADHFPNGQLLPSPGTPARAKAYRWLAFMASEIYPMVEIEDYPERFAPAAPEALRMQAVARIREQLAIVERNMAGTWILPTGFSLVDIYAAMFMRWAAGPNWERFELPRLKAMTEALSARPGAGAVWQRHWGAPDSNQ